MESSDSHELDLPLMSNIGDIHVRHFVLDLQCNFDIKTFSGSITLFCEPRGNDVICSASEQSSTHSESNKTYQKQDCVVDISGSQNRSLKHDLEKSGDPSVCLKKACKLSASSSIERHEYIPNSEESLGHKANVHSVYNVSSQNASQYYTAEHSYAKYNVEETYQLKKNISHTSNNFETSLSTCAQIDECIYKKTDSFTSSKSSKSDNRLDLLPSVTCENDNYACKESATEVPIMVLDSWDLEVERVEELHSPARDLTDYYLGSKNSTDVEKLRLYEVTKSSPTQLLKYTNKKKCLKIWKDGLLEWAKFPQVIRIHYETCHNGQSLKWTHDQDGRPCVYTHGHWINNRSLFPSQDVPVAMATWAAYIHTPADTLVLMSGDSNPKVSPYKLKEGYQTYYYYTNMEMPSSTLALAIGCWEQTDLVSVEKAAKNAKSDRSLLPCRLFSPRKYLVTAKELLYEYMPRCMESSLWLLGPHPFSRLDILVVPSSFASLGMASPSLMFLSQSVISPDGGMLVRVAHELSHSWFGLLIGPRDWHEEWLSEGFCTYTEGIIHARCMQWTEEETRQHTQLQDFLKYRTLQAEVGNIHTDLQTLRPGEECVSDQSIAYVKNGMNPEKGFMQLHYLKGYFLLRFLEYQVGKENFRTFLQTTVMQFHHKLITSNDVFSLFMEKFSSDLLPELTVTTLREWLDTPGIPSELKMADLKEMPLAETAVALTGRVQKLNRSYSKLHWRKRQKIDLEGALNTPKLNNDQLILLLELLLDEHKLHCDILSSLKKAFKLDACNADVLHRWCELVVKHKTEESYHDVKSFLINHQAMGIYLFGELMVTRDSIQRRLALSTFDCIKYDMEEGIKRTVKSMLFGE